MIIITMALLLLAKRLKSITKLTLNVFNEIHDKYQSFNDSDYSDDEGNFKTKMDKILDSIENQQKSLSQISRKLLSLELKEAVTDVMEYLTVLKSQVRAGVEVIHADLSNVNGRDLDNDDRTFITENYDKKERLAKLSGYLQRKSTMAYEQLQANRQSPKTTMIRRPTRDLTSTIFEM